MSELTETDIYHFREGTFFRAYDKLGAHPDSVDGIKGTRFAVWAPNAAAVHVMGDFNGWDHDRHPMTARASDNTAGCSLRRSETCSLRDRTIRR